MYNKNINELLILLEQAQNENAYENMAKYYLKLGLAYKEEGKTEKAIYYLNRFDNLVGGDDDLYEKFKDNDTMAMDLITDMETEQEPYEKEIQEQVIEVAEDLTILQKMQWLLLTLSRFCTLFHRISALPDFAGIENLDKMLDYFCEGLYGELDEEKEDEISEYYDLIEEVFDSPLMMDYTKKIEIPNQESFAPADLESGDIGTYYLDMTYGALQAFVFGGLDEDDVEMEFAACGILADYYYRTSDADIREEQKIQEERERIFSDYHFVKEEPDKESFQKRVDEYKKVMLI